jgi:hypothetical protein
MRRAAKVDANQPKEVKALRKMGVRVFSLAAVGKGCADTLALLRDQVFLVEWKNPDKSWSLTTAQKEFHERWPVIVAETAQQAYEEIVRRAR